MEGIEHQTLMVALEHMHLPDAVRIGEAAHQVDDAQRLRSPVDHVSEHVERVVRPHARCFEHTVQGAKMPVGIGRDVRGQGHLLD